MSDDLVTVTNNENPIIDLEITSYTSRVEIDFSQSIDSTLSVHNTDPSAHSNIKNAIYEEISATNVLLNNKVNKENGKSLSANDLTDTLKDHYDTAYVNNHAHSNKSLLDSLISTGAGTQYLSNDGTYKTINTNNLINALGTISANFTLVNNQVTTGYVSGNYTLSLPTISDSIREAKCIFDFTTSNSSYPAINTAGATLKKKDGKAIAYSTLSAVRNRLIFITIDGGSNWEVELQLYGGVETSFVQPVLSADGTLGGSSFAVSLSYAYNSYYAYRAFDNSSSTWAASTANNYLIFYNPSALKVSNISITNSGYANECISGYTLYGSSDNSNWTALVSGTNSSTAASANWNISVAEANRGFYKYHKLYATGLSYWDICQFDISATYIAI